MAIESVLDVENVVNIIILIVVLIGDILCHNIQ